MHASGPDLSPFLLLGILLVLALAAGLVLLVLRGSRRPRTGEAAGAVAPAQPVAPAPTASVPRPAAAPTPQPAPEDAAAHGQRAAAVAPGYVFISYSSKDKPTADAVCAVMEQRGVRCWITPRDILPGHDWAESILHAIAGARVCVLIFSASANTSPQVRREIERAVHNEVPIIPFRIEDAIPSESLEYFISTPHWLDAITPPLEAHAIRLAESALALLREPAAKP